MRADDLAFTEGRGCYTSVRIVAGRPRFVDRHVQRLQRAAAALALGAVEETRVRRALDDLIAAAFPNGEGVVRLQVSRDGAGTLHLVGMPRDVGEDRPRWRAIVVPWTHEGPVLPGGHKLTNRVLLSLAGEAADRAGVDEALLFDAAGHLVEGARSNLFVVTAGGELATPAVARGGVAGIARGVAVERIADVAERNLTREDLGTARELIAVNAVRGARPIVEVDGGKVGDGEPGSGCRRLAAALAED